MILYNKHITEYKEIIDKITSELINVRDSRINTREYNKHLNDLIIQNKYISDNIIDIIPEGSDSYKINKLYYLLSKELVILGRDKMENAFITDKRDLMLDIKSKNNIPKNDNSIDSELYNLITWIDKAKRSFSSENPDVLIVTAVPKEFRAIYKKINIVFSVEKINEREDNFEGKVIQEFYQLLNPSYDKYQRDFDYVLNCIITRNGKNVNAIIVLLKEYGSDNSRIATEYLLNEYRTIEEVNLIGVAGHMSNNPNVKIGHLVISTGFYKSTLKKINENSNIKKYNPKGEVHTKFEFIYTKPINYKLNINGFNLKNWKPQKMIEKCPEINNENRQSNIIEIHQGYFVSGYEVVKDIEYKNDQLEIYSEAVAIEMEIAGCYEVCKNKNKIFNTFKVICDWADFTKNKKWQPYSADIAAEFTVDYLVDRYGIEA